MITGAIAVFAEAQIKCFFESVCDDGPAVYSGYYRYSVTSDGGGRPGDRPRRFGRRSNCDPPRSVRGRYDLPPLLRGAHATDNQFVVFHSANHVHIDHGDGVGERHDWMVHVIIRPEQSFFFPTECDENDRTSWPRALFREDAGEFEQPGGSGCIVIRAVMYVAFFRRQTSLTATPQVIVMRANNNYFVLQSRIRAVENADCVRGGNFAANQVS